MTNESALAILEQAKKSGKLKKGINEVTKAVERGTAKFVAYASDVSPKEILMHLPILCKEKGIICVEVGTREELGVSASLPLKTSAIAIVDMGNAKDLIANFKAE